LFQDLALRVIKINLPFTEDIINGLKVDDKLLLNGKILAARDAAHKRMIDCLEKGEALPFNLQEACIYYCGPTPAKEGFPIGACGPTTSGRMDVYVKRLFSEGLRIMIGKGNRNEEVKEQIKMHNGLYLTAIGGAGALYAKSVLSCRCIAWNELGAEAVYEMDVRDFVCYVEYMRQ